MEGENSWFFLTSYLFPVVVIIGALMNILFDIPKNICSSRILKDLSISVLSPREIVILLKMKYDERIQKMRNNDLEQLAFELNDLDYCYATLTKVSRSFAIVIEQLPQELKDAVCIFYLVLRGLDSVEDDMNYPDDQKIVLLRNFHRNLLSDQWSIENVGDKQDYRILLSHFGKVIHVLKSLDLKYQSILIDITERMGNGMSEFVGKTESIETIEDYNLYCHYVAGLVGYGLSSLFSHSGLEDSHIDLHKELSNSMGLFLQKTNIIRDYLEDLQSGRTWWPKQIWMKYASHIGHFKNKPSGKGSLECLNEMIMDALNHVPDVLNYLHRIKNENIFQFCSIPQVMAIATLSELCNNANVFTSNVKIRKGISYKIMTNSSNFDQVYRWFEYFIGKIETKISNRSNSSQQQISQLINRIRHCSFQFQRNHLE